MALAVAWPVGWQPVVVEADPSGGDLAAGFSLAAEPGLVSLAAAARHARHARHGAVLREHTQALPGGLPVVAAPVDAEQATRACDLLTSIPDLRLLCRAWPAESHDARPVTAVATGDDGHGSPREDHGNGEGEGNGSRRSPVAVIVDVGRLPVGLSAARGAGRLLGAADVMLLVTKPDARSLVHVAARTREVLAVAADLTAGGHGPGGGGGGGGGGVQVLLVDCGGEAGGGYPAAEVSRSLGLAVAGSLPTDTRAAAMLSGLPPGRATSLTRLPLMRRAAGLAHRLARPLHRGEDPAPRRPVDGVVT
jgi:hypothetical protein